MIQRRMTPDRRRQIEELHRAALCRGPEERAALLAQAASEVRDEVTALLAQQCETGTLASPLPAGPGAQVGQYRIETSIGQGGMGVVYRARDTKLNRPVAIKFLSGELADSAARRRFQREAQLASSLNHPHILTVYDTGEFEGRHYLVTEFIDGGTLKNWAKQQPRNWQDVAELLTGVADGLATAHQAGILHRDIKPDNILITASGYAKLADFGLAKLAEGSRSEDVTRTFTEDRSLPGFIVGTIAYMSPEQASGMPLDARSDIFSFGAVLYEMLAGRRPFAAATGFELLRKVIHDSPAPLGDEIPEPLRALVSKALEKDPERRYSSMRDVVADLRRARQDTSVSLPPPKPRRKWMTAAGFAALAVAAAGGAILFLSRQASGPAQREYIPLTNFSDSVVAPALSPDGRMLAFIRGARSVETGGVGAHRLGVQARHQGDQGRAVDPAGQKHAVRHVAALVQIDAFFQRTVKAGQRRIFVDVFRTALGEPGNPAAIKDMTVGAGDCLARQHALNALEDRVGARGELQLQQFLPRRRPHRAPDQTCDAARKVLPSSAQ